MSGVESPQLANEWRNLETVIAFSNSNSAMSLCRLLRSIRGSSISL